jgi:NAD(P)-dependent dehydrogenase (short-subunit alcohol dehydrogenase family)
MAADLMDLPGMRALVTGRTRGIKSAPRRNLRSS